MQRVTATRLRRRAEAIRRAPPALLGRAVAAWLVSGALLSASFLLAWRAQQQGERARQAYGETVEVWVVQRPVAGGAALGPADVRAQRLPRVLLPDGAVAAGEAIAGRRARAALVVGEVVLHHRVSEGAAVAALAADGQLAVAVPAEWAPAGVQVGDQVAMFTPSGAVGPGDPAWSGGALEQPGAIAVEGTVLAVEADAGRMVVAVSPADAALLAAPLLRGELVVALVAPDR